MLAAGPFLHHSYIENGKTHNTSVMIMSDRNYCVELNKGKKQTNRTWKNKVIILHFPSLCVKYKYKNNKKLKYDITLHNNSNITHSRPASDNTWLVVCPPDRDLYLPANDNTWL